MFMTRACRTERKTILTWEHFCSVTMELWQVHACHFLHSQQHYMLAQLYSPRLRSNWLLTLGTGWKKRCETGGSLQFLVVFYWVKTCTKWKAVFAWHCSFTWENSNKSNIWTEVSYRGCSNWFQSLLCCWVEQTIAWQRTNSKSADHNGAHLLMLLL